MEQDGQLTFEDNPLTVQYRRGQECLKRCAFAEAEELFDEIFDTNPHYRGIEDALKTAKFWLNRQERIEKRQNGKQRAEFLQEEWEHFRQFINEQNIQTREVLHAITHGVINEIIRHLTIYFQELDTPDVSVLCKLARAFLIIGDYRKAKETLDYALGFNRHDGIVLLLLGETLYHTIQTGAETMDSEQLHTLEQRSQYYLREAFMVSPQDIIPDDIHIPEVSDALKRIRADGKEKEAEVYWLPIYLRMAGFLRSVRPMQEADIATMHENAQQLERSLAESKFQRGILIPQLLNQYLWLFDYYHEHKQSRRECDSIEQNIQQWSQPLAEYLHLEAFGHKEQHNEHE